MSLHALPHLIPTMTLRDLLHILGLRLQVLYLQSESEVSCLRLLPFRDNDGIKDGTTRAWHRLHPLVHYQPSKSPKTPVSNGS